MIEVETNSGSVQAFGLDLQESFFVICAREIQFYKIITCKELCKSQAALWPLYWDISNAILQGEGKAERQDQCGFHVKHMLTEIGM